MHDFTARPTSHVFRLVFLSLGVALLTLLTRTPPAAGSELRNSPIVKAVQNVRDSVVSHPRRKDGLPRRQVQRPESKPGKHVNGMGTGVIIDPRGYIITNHHVVDGVKEIQVTLASSGSDHRRTGRRSLAPSDAAR